MTRRAVLSALAVVVFLASFVAGWGYREFTAFLEQSVPETLHVTVQKGWSLSLVAGVLERDGAVSSAFWFKVLGRFHGGGHIQAGAYQFEKGETPLVVLARLRGGEVMRHKLALPEGLTVREVVARMRLQGWEPGEGVLNDAALLKRLHIDAPSLEGWLFPDTYYYHQGDTFLDLVTRMTQRSRHILEKEWAGRAKGVSLTPYQTLILASIIEKETGQGHERSRISAVFHNRLRLDMKLQTDPTVIYGIADFDGNITRKHLLTPTPFNTYVRKGLPPTPICNPGQAAIHAAVHPDTTKELYFVSRGDGTHVFSKTFEEHDAYVDRYQRKKKRAGPRKEGDDGR